MFKKKVKNVPRCEKCGKEIEWLRSNETGELFAVNIGKKPTDEDYLHSKTCNPSEKTEITEEPKEEKEVEKPKEETPKELMEAKGKKDLTVGDVLNNHEARIRELEGVVSKILEYIAKEKLGYEGVEKR